MVCPRCTAECSAESRFCHRCGSELKPLEVLHCPACNAVLSGDVRFCSSCGSPVDRSSVPAARRTTFPLSLQRLLPPQYVEKLQALHGAVEGERRIVTILFSDVKGSTSLAENLDPEQVLEIMNGAFKVLIDPIIRYEGTLARLMGDAIMAFFGAPIAHEDDAVRACRAALDIIDGVRQYAARLESERGVKGFDVRVGLNTGLVVVAEVGSDLRAEYSAMGDSVNLASRMEAAAEPGTILLTGSTLELTGDCFEVESKGLIHVKGKSEAVDVYRLLGAKDSHAVDAGSRRTDSLLVGRQDELCVLKASLSDLAEARGGILCITGDMGTGKSRLVQEARKGTPGAVWLDTRSHAYTEGMGFWTLRQLLKGFRGGRAEGAACAGNGDPLEQRIASPSTGGFGPCLSTVLGFRATTEPSGATCRELPEGILPHVVQEFRVLLKAVAETHPLVLLWDDLQWIDPSSLSVLESVLPVVDEIPVLFLLLFRPDSGRMVLLSERISDRFPERKREILVRGLERSHATLLLDRLLAGRNAPSDIRDVIIRRTEGNPLFLVEIVRQLWHQGKSKSGNGAAADALFSIPNTLRGMIMARIDGLPFRDRRTLQTASVLGRTFGAHLLRQILPEEVSEKDMAASIDELVRREFIAPQQRSGPDEGPGQIYSFTHSLTYEVAHESLLLAQRKDLHGRAADAIKASFPGHPARLAEILAMHYEIAGDKDQAFLCFMEAGEHAKSIYAHLEAINYFRRALKLATEMRIKGAMLRNLFEDLGDAYAVAAKYPAALEQFDTALALPQNVHRRATLLRKRGAVYEKSGRYDEAAVSYNEGLTVLTGTSDLEESARLYSGLGRVRCLKGEYRLAIKLSCLALEIMEKNGETGGIARACSDLGLIYVRAGEHMKALEHLQRALGIWEDRKDSVGLSAARNNLGQFYHQQCDYREAANQFLQSIELCRQTGNRHGLATAYDNLGQCLAAEGKLEEAGGYLAKAVAILADIGAESSDLVPELWLQEGTW